MITRIWRGWTTPQNAAAYQRLLLEEIFPSFASRPLPGYRGISLGRRDIGDEVEFVTIMWFDSLDSVRAFAGDSYEVAVVPPKARALLSKFDERSAHYETVVDPPRSVSA
jgi:antibiotic biosynthesis monooxygenase (ABM) superfamily enzyme